MISREDITIDRNRWSAMLTLSAIVAGHRVTRRYQGYTVREAVALFMADVNP